MTVLLIGLAFFVGGHFWKRAMPGVHSGLGPAAKGISGVITIIGLLVIIYGYRNAQTGFAYAVPVWGAHLNWVLMFFAVGLLGAGHSKGRIKTWFRHPMLMSVIVWAAAHLIANGDWASVILFGTLGLWAIAEIFVINATSAPWVRPAPGPIVRDVVLLGITIGVYAAMVGIHIWVGVNPFASITG